MKARWLLAAAMLLLVPSVLLAANTVDWEDPFVDNAVKNDLAPGSCRLLEISSSETNESRFLFVGGLGVTFQFEADNTGSNTNASVDIEVCTSPDGDRDGTADTNACDDFDFVDTDGDGINDSNELNNTADGHRGTTQPAYIAGWLYFDPTSTPSSGDESEVMVCAKSES